MSLHSIDRLPTQKPTLYAFEVNGKITKPDIERMADELELAFDHHGVVDLIILIRDWDGMELGAVFDAKAISAQARANSHIRKYAVVGAPGWARAMITLFSPLTPVEERTFASEDSEEAWAWVSS